MTSMGNLAMLGTHQMPSRREMSDAEELRHPQTSAQDANREPADQRIPGE